MKKLFRAALALFLLFNFCFAKDLWTLEGGGIKFEPQKGVAHRDRIEMSGLRASAILTYGVDSEGSFYSNTRAVFPTFRMRPNLMESAFMRDFDIEPLRLVNVGIFGAVRDTPNQIRARLKEISLSSILEAREFFKGEVELEISRKVAVSPSRPAIVQVFEIKNLSKKAANVEVPDLEIKFAPKKELCEFGEYEMKAEFCGAGAHKLKPGETLKFSFAISAAKKGEALEIDAEREVADRLDFGRRVSENLVLESSDRELDAMFSFAKIRALESVFESRAGLMHCPGGGRYYMGFWANDQAEYASPFFPFAGNENANRAALNMFRLFASHAGKDYKMIPSAITAEGKLTWNGKGDRGDAAMLAYGAARYALASSNPAEARELEGLIDWCLEYCRRNLNSAGVARSDCDELELRYPAGEANLCTSCLYYDALISASFIKREFGKLNEQRDYLSRAEALRKNIKKYFESEVEGFDTYRYYEGNKVLRSWICIPLCVGIFDKSKGTAEALLSPKLLTKGGMLVQSGERVYWDRTYLYALRGLFACGEFRAYQALREYVKKRLLGDHVPYAIEAYPEGDKRHLSAESALFCRVVTEGIFGIRPAGFKEFELRPRLGEGLEFASLKNIRAFGETFDLRISREGEFVNVEVASKKSGKSAKRRIKSGEGARVKFADKDIAILPN